MGSLIIPREGGKGDIEGGGGRPMTLRGHGLEDHSSPTKDKERTRTFRIKTVAQFVIVVVFKSICTVSILNKNIVKCAKPNLFYHYNILPDLDKHKMEGEGRREWSETMRSRPAKFQSFINVCTTLFPFEFQRSMVVLVSPDKRLFMKVNK